MCVAVIDYFLFTNVIWAEVGKIAIEKKVLSQITSLVLKQPISLLKEYELLESIDFVELGF